MTDQTPTTTLTDAEKITLCTCRKGDRAERCLERIAAVESILAAREAHTNTLRAAIVGAMDDFFGHAEPCDGRCDGGDYRMCDVGLFLTDDLRDALDAAPAPTDNQHNNELADRVRALADKIRDGEPTAETLNGKSKAWLAGERHARHVAAFRVRAVVDGPTTPTQESAQ